MQLNFYFQIQLNLFTLHNIIQIMIHICYSINTKYEYVVKSEKLHTFKTQNIENRMLAHYTLYICIQNRSSNKKCSSLYI